MEEDWWKIIIRSCGALRPCLRCHKNTDIEESEQQRGKLDQSYCVWATCPGMMINGLESDRCFKIHVVHVIRRYILRCTTDFFIVYSTCLKHQFPSFLHLSSNNYFSVQGHWEVVIRECDRATYTDIQPFTLAYTPSSVQREHHSLIFMFKKCGMKSEKTRTHRLRKTIQKDCCEASLLTICATDKCITKLIVEM